MLHLLEDEPRGCFLDAAAGVGALVPRLLSRGFSVEACDIDPAAYVPQQPPCRQVDLNQPLPYATNSLDGIICLEALEHLLHPRFTVQEFGRVVRRDGCLIVSTPNIQSVYSRLHFLLFGTFDFFDTMSPCPGAFWAQRGHISPLPFPVLRHALNAAGFTLERVATNRLVSRALAVRPIAHLATRLAEVALSLPIRCATAWKYPGDRNAQSLRSPVLLRGENLVLKARRVDDERG
ncbi:MAG: class I SAM-dependent methyltransferase [candidate division NC10 bacterium]|nr:class I SAM-dependent methyltransferase [candidate division NC10 bacterium]